jgi:predicted RNA-binding protein YlxR (DUF448 family)
VKNRKIPLRKCVVTKEQLPKQELVRVVRNKELGVKVDTSGRLNGRGAYLKLQKSVILKAKKSNVLGRHLDCEIPDSIYEELLGLLDE